MSINRFARFDEYFLTTSLCVSFYWETLFLLLHRSLAFSSCFVGKREKIKSRVTGDYKTSTRWRTEVKSVYESMMDNSSPWQVRLQQQIKSHQCLYVRMTMHLYSLVIGSCFCEVMQTTPLQSWEQRFSFTDTFVLILESLLWKHLKLNDRLYFFFLWKSIS
jgi:hypothetical protein